MAAHDSTTTPEPGETTAPTLGGAHLTRRRLLAAAPALGLATAPAAAAEPETEVMRMFRDWLDASRVSNNLPAHMSDAEVAPFFARSTNLANRIVHLQSASAEDLLLKLAAHTSYFEYYLSGCPGEAAILAELDHLLRKLVPQSAGALAWFRPGEA